MPCVPLLSSSWPQTGGRPSTAFWDPPLYSILFSSLSLLEFSPNTYLCLWGSVRSFCLGSRLLCYSWELFFNRQLGTCEVHFKLSFSQDCSLGLCFLLTKNHCLVYSIKLYSCLCQDGEWNSTVPVPPSRLGAKVCCDYLFMCLTALQNCLTQSYIPSI